MSSSDQDPVDKNVLASRLLAVEGFLDGKMEEAKKRMAVAQAQHRLHSLFENLMQSVKIDHLKVPERTRADRCPDCDDETVVVYRHEDTSVVFGGLTSENITYVICFACCTAWEPIGGRTDETGRHYGGRRSLK